AGEEGTDKGEITEDGTGNNTEDGGSNDDESNDDDDSSSETSSNNVDIAGGLLAEIEKVYDTSVPASYNSDDIVELRNAIDKLIKEQSDIDVHTDDERKA
ncbi:hypothetical protein ONS95_009671, partial [Cadophora gregata]|uniref:uncharacterized protein n=1 Tax=Cadophora gregata TaxID=51156 RepID=UPI0026DBD8C1